MMKIRFWGVRGSVPSPISGSQIEEKIVNALLLSHGSQALPATATRDEILEWLRTSVPFERRSTFGGNTTCVEVRCGDSPIILDMGTGLRELGINMVPEILARKSMSGAIFQSHVHWDHIQGLPFWKPLYMPRTSFDCRFSFFGGKEWDAQLEAVLAGQMNPPVFPVNLQELRRTAMRMDFTTIWDGWSTDLAVPDHVVHVKARKLHHPQETFGYRIERGGRTLVFTTDHEPYAAGLPRPLIELVRGADVWITDCQYTEDGYTGKADGVQKHGWGHSYPAFIAAVAREAQPGHIITTHHDPEASDALISLIAADVEERSGIQTRPAFEGLVVNL